MVLINIKSTPGGQSRDDGFLYETTASTKIEDLIESLVNVHNARIRARLVADRPRDAPDAPMSEELAREIRALEDYVDKRQVQNKTALTLDGVEARIESVRGAVAALPEDDATRKLVEDPIDTLKAAFPDAGFLDAEEAALWTCNKPWLRGQLVAERLGSRNEKTKVIAKLAYKEDGAPAREPVVNEAERQAMSAFYFKRQEELKRLAEADGDDYLGSDWADPKGMQRNLQGLSDVKAPGLHF